MSRFTRYVGQTSSLPSFIQSREAADETPLKKEYILVDSRDRDVSLFKDPGEYVVKLPETLHQVSKVTLIGAEVPSSFYVFTQQRNNTSIILTYYGVKHTIRLEDGNYGFSSMITALKDAFNAACATSLADTPFDVTLDPKTLRLSIRGPIILSGSIREEFSISIESGDREWPLGYYLGFGRETRTISSVDGIITGEYVCSLNPEVYILVDIDGVNQILESSVLGEGGTMGMTSAIIPLNVDSFQYVFYDRPIIPNRIKPAIPQMNSMHIKFRFHDGTPINFNGINHALTLEIECSRTR
jgi:hypothetical protein